MLGRVCCATLIFLVLPGNLVGDSWALPQKKSYYSPNKRYRLDVTPKDLASQLQYFEDKVAGAQNAGAVDRSGPATARAVFRVRGSLGRFVKRFAFPLINEVSPVNVLVADDGNHFATFDDWHGVGYGDRVVVVYRSTGELLAQFSLQDLFTPDDIETFNRSVSSIWWGGQHSIEGTQLVLRVVPRKSPPGSTGREVRIDLATGRPLAPKRHLFPELHATNTATIRIRAASEPPAAGNEGFQCLGGAPSLSSAGIPNRQLSQPVANSLRLPTFATYPPLARAAGIQGGVLADVLLNSSGEVTCVRVRSGHPLLSSAALELLLKSQIEKSLVAAEVQPLVSTVWVEFSIRPVAAP